MFDDVRIDAAIRARLLELRLWPRVASLLFKSGVVFMHSKYLKLPISTAIVLLAGAYGTASFGEPATDAAMPAAGPAMMLSGAQEVPPVETNASGTSTITVGADMSVTGSVNTVGFKSTNAHIHLGAVGVSGPVVLTLVKTSDTQWSVSPNTKLTADQYQSYKAGDLYVNVHSDVNKGGEIRLQLKP